MQYIYIYTYCYYIVFLHALVFISCSAALPDGHRSCCVQRANVFQAGTVGVHRSCRSPNCGMVPYGSLMSPRSARGGLESPNWGKNTFVTGNIAFDCCCVHQHMLLDPDALETASLVPVHLSRLCPGNPFPLELLSPNSRPQMVVSCFSMSLLPVWWSPSPSRIPAGPEFPLPYVA